MSEILVDNLTGKTSAGSITVTSEGGAATQSLQQGLAKAWMTENGDGSAVNDSLNTASLTDNSVGNFTQNYTASFNNAYYSWTGQQEHTFPSTGAIIAHVDSGKTTSATLFYTYASGNGGFTDTGENCTQVTGDLA